MNSSFSFKSLLLTVPLLLASWLSSSLCGAWSLVEQPVEGVLLLRNGNVLRGKVQQQGERYHVYVPNGRLQVRAAQVETFCLNLEQVYQHRCETRGGTSADSHLALASWCLRHDLLEQAAAQLGEVEQLDPDHPRLGLLQRQWKQARQLASRETQQRAENDAVVQPEDPIDPSTLEKAPKWARALFVRQIQPLVIHSCATSGCHQRDSGEDFRLNRLALGGVGHPEATLRNLVATLEQIDWQSTDQSALLRRAQQAHGEAGVSTPLPAHKLQVLQGWIEQLAEAHRKENEMRLLPPIVEVAALPTSQPLILNPPAQANREAPDAAPASSDPKPQVRPVSFEPVDPFDPSAFNQRSTSQEPGEIPVPHASAPSEPLLIPASAAE